MSVAGVEETDGLGLCSSYQYFVPTLLTLCQRGESLRSLVCDNTTLMPLVQFNLIEKKELAPLSELNEGESRFPTLCQDTDE